MQRHEEATWWQGDRAIAAKDVAYIRTCVKRFPGLSRTELTYTLCEHLEWLTPAGRPQFEACAKLLARLEAAGELQRPALQEDQRHPGPYGGAAFCASAESAVAGAVVGTLSQLDPVGLRVVSDSEEERLWNAQVERSHPLGSKKPVGYWARYFIESGEHRLGCILLAGAAKALGAPDRWIGWTDRQRLANLPRVLNHSRYLIFPGVAVANLASHVLAQLARRVGDDWQARWGDRPLLLAPVVDPARFRGTCYRAAGWTLVGRTTGAGLVRPGKHYRPSPKLMFAKPLPADFRRLPWAEPRRGHTAP
jgi:Druantia protein DruA